MMNEQKDDARPKMICTFTDHNNNLLWVSCKHKVTWTIVPCNNNCDIICVCHKNPKGIKYIQLFAENVSSIKRARRHTLKNINKGFYEKNYELFLNKQKFITIKLCGTIDYKLRSIDEIINNEHIKCEWCSYLN
jgi:hypothetical protein